MFCSNTKKSVFFFLFLIVFGASVVRAQRTEFTFQGRITDAGGTAANYDFEFRLCASDSNCNPPLGTVQRLGVPTANAVFSVRLDFGDQFNGETRYLEIGEYFSH